VTRPRRLSKGVAATLVAATSIMLLLVTPNVAAADPTSTPGLAVAGLPTETVIVDDDFNAAFTLGHRCETFGAAVAGYRAGHCADVDFFTNSIGQPATRGQGQAFCQRVSDNAIVQCAGISQSIWVFDLNNPGNKSEEYNPRCGRYATGDPCPTGRFQNLGSGIYYCNYALLYAIVRTTIVLPVSGETQRSDDFASNGVEAICT
jgi:hypothetical protein